MGLAGSRFDPEVMMREAEAARRRERKKKIQSLVANGCVLVGLGIAALIGWRYWQDYRAEQERLAHELQAREARERADAARKEAARKEAERVKREQELARQKAERQRQEEERRRQAREREELRIKQEQERIRQRQEREEARRLEEENRAETARRKFFVDTAMASLPVSVTDHIAVRRGLEDRLTMDVDGNLWSRLNEAVTKKSALELFEIIRDSTMTNDFSETCYPDRETFNRMLKNLNGKVFHLIIRPSESASDLEGLTLVALDEKGLSSPKGARELTSPAGGRAGWTVPFVFGDESNIFLMETSAAASYSRSWRKIRSRMAADADMADEIKTYARSIRLDLSHPMPVEQPKKAVVKPKTKPKASFKNSSDIRSFRSSRR